jgi:hypothetical protein
MIHIMSQGGLEKSRRDLLKAAGIKGRMQKAVTNLKYLDIDINQKKGLAEKRVKQFEEALRIELKYMRYVPAIQEILSVLQRAHPCSRERAGRRDPCAQSLAADRLDEEDYPYVKGPPPKEDGVKQRVMATLPPDRLLLMPVCLQRPRSLRLPHRRAGAETGEMPARRSRRCVRRRLRPLLRYMNNRARCVVGGHSRRRAEEHRVRDWRRHLQRDARRVRGG